MQKPTKNQSGLTLMEVIISLSIIMLIVMGIYSLIILSIQLNVDNKRYVEAIEIANQQMEYIRNLPYVDVGTASGSPAGVIQEWVNINREGDFTVHNTVMFYDDEFDGTLASSTDTVFVDYKIATVEVSWNSRNGTQKTITMFSKIIPSTMETLAGYGLLLLRISDSSGAPVPSASIHIENPNNGLSVDLVSDSNGTLNYPVLPDLEAYEVSVTKAGYSIDQTYDRDGSNPNPTKPHLSVFVGTKTEDNFMIEKLATLQVKTVINSLPDNELANTSSADRDNSNSALSIDNTDDIYLAWQADNATSSFVYIQKLDSALNRQWASDIKVSNTLFQTSPDIASTNAGNTFVVWQDNSRSLKSLTRIKPKTNFYIARASQAPINLDNYDIFNFSNHYQKIYSTPLTSTSNAKPFRLSNIWQKLKIPSAYALGTVTFVGVGAGDTTGHTSNITLDVPGGVQEDDLMLALVHHDDYSNGPIVAPGGWSTLVDNLYPAWGSNDSRGAIFYKLAGASEPANYTFTLSSGSEQKAGHIRVYRGVDILSPFDGTYETHTTGDGNIDRPCPSHDVNDDGSMLVCAWATDTRRLGENSPNFPASMSNTRLNYADYITIASADESVDTIDSPTPEKDYDANRYVTRSSIHWSLVLKPEAIPDYISVSSIGSQIATTTTGGTDIYLGGAFVFTESNTNHTITSITLTENGTTDALNDLNNVRLFYDLDTAAPYDCADENFNILSDSQFGLSGNFDAADGTITFTEGGGVAVNTTQTMCAYVVLDVDANAQKNDTISVRIADPSTDVVIDSGTPEPASVIDISGSTQLLAPADITQYHYRYMNDDGDELSATWRESENTPTSVLEGEIVRLRFHVSNEGSLDSGNINYQIEYGQKLSTCDAIAAWNSVPTGPTGHFKISDSSNITDNDPSTNIAGISDENTIFSAGYLKDLSNQTNQIKLTGTEFTEIEFSLEATSNATEDPYCFRLSDAGSAANISYINYPEISVIGDYNVFISYYNSSGAKQWGPKRIHLDSSSADQLTPAIALTENFGTATTVVAWADDRNSNYDIYMQSFDPSGNRLWGSDVQVTADANDDTNPVIAIDTNDDIVIAWENDSSSELYCHKYDLDGNSIWAGRLQVNTNANPTEAPSITTDSSDNIYITWHEDNLGNMDVRLAKVDSLGVIDWEIDANQEDLSENQSYADVMVIGSDLIVNWQDDRDSNTYIYSQKFDLSGTAQWASDQKITSDSSDNKTEPCVGLLSSGDIVSAWQDFRDSPSNIYIASYGDPGAVIAEPNVPIILESSNLKGTGPDVYKIYETHETDGTGYIDIPVEFDITGYKITLNSASTSLNIVSSNPVNPVSILAEEFKTVTIYVE